MARIATFYDHILDAVRQEEISAVEAMKEAKAVGVELLEVNQNNFLGREKDVEKELGEAGLGISAVPAYFDFGRDPDVEKQSLPTLEGARYLGAKKLLVIPGFFAENDPPEERERQREKIAEGVNRLADLAAGYGVTLTMEDYDGALAPFATAEGMRYFLDRCPGLSACFDTGNFRFSAQDVHDAYELLRGRIDHVHLKDRAFSPSNGEKELIALDGKALYPCPVGSGELDVAGIIEKLKCDGYDGVYTVEHYGSNRALDYIRRSARWAREHI